MKIPSISKIGAAVLALSLVTMFVAPQAQAGPGPQQIYYPIRTAKEAGALKPGAKVAVTCGACGAMTLMKAGKDGALMHSFTCPACKTEFRVQQIGSSGKTATIGRFVYVDKKGHTAHLMAAR